MTRDTHRPGDRPAGPIHATRSAALGRHGMIATSQPLASAAGLQVLQEGGNAVDAAVAAAAVLAVVEPSMTGVGGDLFALVHDPATGQVHGLDGCGCSGSAASLARFEGLSEVPAAGPLTIDVPGVVDGWSELLARFGTRPLDRLLAPAIRYARDGFPVHEIVASEWRDAEAKLAQDAAAAATFLPAGRAPHPGEVFANPRLAGTLEAIAAGGRDVFYRGAVAEAIAADLAARGALVTADDLATHASEWQAPIRTSYRGVELLEMPPSTQGFVALEMLNILEGYDIAALGHNTADYLHVVTEAKRIAFADRGAWLADRDAMPAGLLTLLLSKDYAAQRRRDIDMAKAAAGYAPATLAGASPGRDFAGRDRGDTIYLACADARGYVVSLIQSLFGSFGSGVVAGDTGIALANRGSGFVLAPGHPNVVAPRKRPLHTLVPAMLVKDGRPWVAFGVMGGDNQAQAHAQLVTKLVDFAMPVQVAGEAARMRHTGTDLALESAIGDEVRQALQARGHTVRDGCGHMGGYQAVMIDPATGVLMGGSDPRKDGLAIGW